ncbi:MAG: hypothetical protein M3548_15430 [Actinomycetota bacterium]|nr:hypothetical protein [Actinomycetota bacterium]
MTAVDLDVERAALVTSLDADGFALTPPPLAAEQCPETAPLSDCDTVFRSTVAMARYAYGKGRDHYFTDPPVPIVDTRYYPWHWHRSPAPVPASASASAAGAGRGGTVGLG